MTFSLQLPADAIESTLKVSLNGRDVSDHFRGSEITLSESDGMSPVKNVISATVKTSSGNMASGRWRSMNLPVSEHAVPSAAVSLAAKVVASSARANAVAATASVCDPVAMCPAWLPPSVSFTTIAKGNWNGSTPWIAVNGVPYGQASGAQNAHYVMAVFSRQTLQLEDFEWFGAGADATAYIQKYTSNDLVVLGSTLNVTSVDPGLDTSHIGGFNFGSAAVPFIPKSYMIIGYGGQAAGTAYQSHTASGATATGALDEDVNGNYSFQSSDVVEYAIEPGTATANAQIILKVPPDLSVAGETNQVLVGPSLANNGLWLVVLDRASLVVADLPGMPSTCAAGTVSNGILPISGCGVFFSTSIGAGANQWGQLATALNNVSQDQLVFLVSVGKVGATNLGTTVESGTAYTGFKNFATALQAVGGTPLAVVGPTFTNQDTYALLGFLGAGNALTGGAAEASSAIPGQLGVLHGTLQRDAYGNYRPSQASQEQQGLFDAKGGLNDSDYTLAIASYQQPVPWPSNSASVLLPNASSIQGQQAAYRFLSHWLLAGFYMKGIQGPHQDDIHYFFSGSTNTSINYHIMDPANLQFPGQGNWDSFGCSESAGGNCTFQAPGDSAPSSFTSADFSAVTNQLSTEVIYLTNALQYLVTGSTNLKDVIANGSANTGLALTAAANTVLGSGMANLNAQQIASKQVTFSWQALVSLLAGVAELAANVASGGELTPAFEALNAVNQQRIKEAVAAANVLGSAMSVITSASEIRTETSTISSSPQPFAPLTTTVGELASADLQSPLLSGFDTLTDNITSDWGRLSTIAPRVMDVTDPAFFAPNQLQDVSAVNALTISATRSFYFSLLPTVYNLHFWNGVAWYGQTANTFQPTMGSFDGHNIPAYEGCNAFYLSPNTSVGHPLGSLSPYQGITYPTIGGLTSPFIEDPGAYDIWIVDGVVSKAGSSAATIQVMDPTLATSLFSPSGLSTPMLQFFSSNGPMASVTLDASVDNISGFSSDNICDASDPMFTPTGVGAPSSGGLGAAPSPGSSLVTTTTTLISPMSGVLGHDAVFMAQVMAGSKPVSAGKVYISVDGTVVGSPALGADGSASLTVPGGLALGSHQIQADSAPGSGFSPSSAQPATFTVYSESPDISIALSDASVNASYNSTSAPLSIQVNSIAGLSGGVALSCTGLPVGLACTFNSQSLNLSPNGKVNATMQIGPTSTNQAVAAIFLLPLLGLGLSFKWRRAPLSRLLMIIAVSLVAGGLASCSGGSSAGNKGNNQETGLKPIVITAQVGAVARSASLNVNLQ